MNLRKIILTLITAIALISVGMVYIFNKVLYQNVSNNPIKLLAINSRDKYNQSMDAFIADAEHQIEIVYDGMTMEELAAKLDRYLTSDLAGKGYLYASHSIKMGVDPYLAVAISMHETGCKWGCSTLVRQCNNVGGQVASPRCGSGNYKYYETLDEGIMGFIDNIYYNYVSYGLLTPNQMNPKYAADPNWAMRVNNYIEQIKQV